jgi:hypothetical protein
MFLPSTATATIGLYPDMPDGRPRDDTETTGSLINNPVRFADDNMQMTQPSAFGFLPHADPAGSFQ